MMDRIYSWIGLAGMLVLTPTAFGTISVSSWSPLYRGIEFASGAADTNETRLQKVFALRVDLTDPTIEFYSTPSNGADLLETVGQTTTTFVQTSGVAVGVNANFFSPVTTIPDDPRELRGLAISRGVDVSPNESSYPPALITRSNQVTFTATPPGDLGNIWTAVAGSDLILISGVPQLQSCTTTFCLDNPRTALGLSQEGRYLYMMVIDGRQHGWSVGATLYETGEWLARFGAWNGLNLDGGGSTAMVRMTNGAALLVNRPSGGVQRVNGNHLGVFAHPLQTSIWNGGGANNQWNNAANWYNNMPVPGPAYDLQFAGMTRLTPSNNFANGSNFRHITFNAGASRFTLAGNSITLNGNLTNNSGSSQTINLPITMIGVRTVAAGSGNLTLGGRISGTGGGLAVVGPGVVIAGADNSYTGATTVRGGTLTLAGSLTNSAGSITVNGGTLKTSGPIITGTGAWSVGNTASDKGIIDVNTGSVIHLAGSFVVGNNPSGSGAVNITGGSLTNTQASASSNFKIGVTGYGALNMSGGKVNVNTFYVGGNSGTAVASISGGAFFAGQPGGADYLLVGGVNSGTGVLTVSGGSLNHAGVNRLISINNNSDGRGELNLLGGAIDNSGGGVGYGYNAGTGTGTGIVNVNRGSLTLNRFVNTKQGGTLLTGKSYLNLNGGTLTASPNTLTSPSLGFSSNFIPARMEVRVNGAFGTYAGGARIDTAGQDCLVEAPLLAPTGNGVTSVAVAGAGSGYIGAPYVSIRGEGSGATAIAHMVDDGTGGGTLKVARVEVTNPGVNYDTLPAVAFEGGAPLATAIPGAVTITPNSSGGLSKMGLGKLILTVGSTYEGPTIISEGMLQAANATGSATGTNSVLVQTNASLAGNGIIAGPVILTGGATLSPGDVDIGTLSISNTLTLTTGSAVSVDVAATTSTSDLVQGISTIHYGGTLQVTRNTGTFAPGQSFKLFSADCHSGTFERVLPAPSAGMVWRFDPAVGVLSVVSGPVPIPTQLSGAFSRGELELSWPESHVGWLAQSNAVNLMDANSWFDIPGSQLATCLRITIHPAMPGVFYRLRLP